MPKSNKKMALNAFLQNQMEWLRKFTPENPLTATEKEKIAKILGSEKTPVHLRQKAEAVLRKSESTKPTQTEALIKGPSDLSKPVGTANVSLKGLPKEMKALLHGGEGLQGMLSKATSPKDVKEILSGFRSSPEFLALPVAQRTKLNRTLDRFAAKKAPSIAIQGIGKATKSSEVNSMVNQLKKSPLWSALPESARTSITNASKSARLRTVGAKASSRMEGKISGIDYGSQGYKGTVAEAMKKIQSAKLLGAGEKAVLAKKLAETTKAATSLDSFKGALNFGKRNYGKLALGAMMLPVLSRLLDRGVQGLAGVPGVQRQQMDLQREMSAPATSDDLVRRAVMGMEQARFEATTGGRLPQTRMMKMGENDYLVNPDNSGLATGESYIGGFGGQ
jgi:hypothetical protein